MSRLRNGYPLGTHPGAQPTGGLPSSAHWVVIYMLSQALASLQPAQHYALGTRPEIHSLYEGRRLSPGP
jgi:hypothetical protein